MPTHICPRCREDFTPGKKVVGKLVGTLAVGAVSSGRGPLAGAAGAFTGLVLGHVIDEAVDTFVAPKCPQCVVALDLITDIMI